MGLGHQPVQVNGSQRRFLGGKNNRIWGAGYLEIEEVIQTDWLRENKGRKDCVSIL
jgi:hypothetical protein